MTAPSNRAFPSGRLSDFESADDEDLSLAALLPRRTKTTTDEQTTPAQKTAPQPSTPHPNGNAATTEGDPDTASGNGTQDRGNNTPDGGQAPSTPRGATTAPAKKAAAKKTAGTTRARTQQAQSTNRPQAPATSPAASDNDNDPAPANPVSGRGNLIKPSSAQIPSALIPLIARRREETGRSNGEIVLDAIEATHPDLGTLLHPRGQAGGGLFAARASRGVRKVDGPLTGLNIRLYAADYDVIDQLVAQFGALSRGHLISVALTAFLHEDSTE